MFRVSTHEYSVPKPNEKWRPVINLKPFNQFIKNGKFRMETVKDMRSILRCGMWAATVDLKDAYYHIGLDRRSRRYFRFLLDGKIMNLRPYQWDCQVVHTFLRCW